jgi:3D (Asp-Asp-Asp) domain-containing protein
MQSAKSLGIPGFALGGALKKVGGAASSIVGKLPGNPFPDPIKGVGRYVLNKAKDFIGDKAKSALGAVTHLGGGASVHGLLPRVLRALEWARGHGWHGSVTSGYRSHASQQYLWDNAARLGLIRGVSVARPGTSSHEMGAAVDVTDIPGFQKAMASAPPDSRLLWRGPSDPVHFSITGHKKGGLFGGRGIQHFFKGGKFSSTAYGPPWGGIQGTGVTRTGVNLKGSPHMYGIAVDPSVIPLGSMVKAWPNPFNYHGAFKAFDTGGAIKGRRIDFYDWRGRKAQMGWGRRTVSISAIGRKIAGKGKKATGGMGTIGSSSDIGGGGAFAGHVTGSISSGGYVPGSSGIANTSAPPSDSTGDDPNQALIDALNADREAREAAAEAARQQTEALNALKAEVLSMHHFATSVAGVTSVQAIKALADVISGQIVGVGYKGRALSASAGSTVRY